MDKKERRKTKFKTLWICSGELSKQSSIRLSKLQLEQRNSLKTALVQPQ